MAEFAGAIVGLIQVAEHVGLKIFRYIKHTMQAEKEICQLSATIASLVGTIHGIELAIRELEHHNKQHVLRSADIVACKNIISELSTKLSVFVDQAQIGGKVQTTRIRKKWRWPFTMSETAELNLKLESHKSALNLTLAADNLTALLRMSDSQEAVQNRLGKIEVGLKALAQIKMTKKREKDLQRLYSQSPLHHHLTNRRLRHVGTGDWFIQSTEFEKWMAEANGKLWVHGIPGAGKSILAAYAIDQILADTASLPSGSDRAVAYFYCDYKDSMTQTPRSVLGSLAQQIARQDERNFAALEDFLKKFSLDRQTGTLAYECEDLRCLLSTMAANIGEVLLIVDGIDECEGFAAEVSASLARLAQDTIQIKLILFSRHIIEISQQLENFDTVSIAAQNSDLLLFIGEQIGLRTDPKSLNPLKIRDPRLKDEILETLVNKAEGMFRWAALQIDYISGLPTDKAIREALETLPHDIFSSYERLLVQVNKKPRSIRCLFERAIKWILGGKLSIRGVCEAISIDPGAAKIDPAAMPDKIEILRHCGSFVRESFGRDSFEFTHFTVKEFFSTINITRNPEFSSYYCEHKEVQTFYAKTALTYLCTNETKADLAEISDQDDRRTCRDFRRVTLQEWYLWLQHCSPDQTIDGLTTKLFTDREGAILRAWILEFIMLDQRYMYEGSPYTEDALLRIIASLSPLHYAAMLHLPETCRVLVGQGYSARSPSPLGNPLCCALLGLSSFYVWKHNPDRDSKHNSGWLSEDLSSYSIYLRIDTQKLKQTLLVLSECGADVNERQHLASHRDFSPSLLNIAINIVNKYFMRDTAGFTINKNFGHINTGDRFDIVKCLNSLGAVYSDRGSVKLLLSLLEKDLTYQQTFEKHSVLLETLCLSELDTTDRQKLERLMERWRCNDPLSYSVGRNVQARTGAESVKNMSQALWFDAAKYNYLDVTTRFLLLNAIDINAQDQDGSSALHLAVQWISTEVVHALVANGANINQASQTGSTALLEALAVADTPLIHYLIANGADCTAITHNMESAWHFAARNLKLAPLQQSQIPLSAVCNLVDGKDSKGQTPLAIAASCANKDGFLSLWEMEVDQSAVDSYGRTLLHHAARGGNPQLVEFLIVHGHNVITRDAAGYNALLYATSQKPQNQSLIECQRLLYQADDSCAVAETKEGHCVEDFILTNLVFSQTSQLIDVDWGFLQRLLMHNAQSGLNKLITKLRKYAAAKRSARAFGTPDTFSDFDLALPEHYSRIKRAKIDYSSCYDYIIAHDPERVRSHDSEYEFDSDQDFGDFTEDHVNFEDVENTESHLENRITLNTNPHERIEKLHGSWTKLANMFETCTELVLSENQLIYSKVLEALLTGVEDYPGLNSSPDLVRLVCHIINGLETKVLQAVRIKNRQLLNWALCSQCPELELCLIAKKLDVDEFNGDVAVDSKNAVQIACAGTCTLVTFKAIIAASENIRLVDRFGKGLVHLAVSSSDMKRRPAKVNHLLQIGLEVDAQSYRGETALHIASHSGSARAVQLLLENGANQSLQDISGYTAAQYAAKLGRVQVLRQLAVNKSCWTNTCDLRIEWIDQTDQWTDDRDQRTVRGVSLLHLAAASGSIKTIAFLLNLPDMFDINGTAEQDASPLQLAVWHNRRRAAEFLLASKANMTPMLWQAMSLLHVAARRGNSAMVTTLLKHGHSISITDAKGSTPLEYAVRAKRMNIVKILREQTPEESSHGATRPSHALGLAIEWGDLMECVKLVRGGASLDEVCCQQTKLKPILYALYHGQFDIAKHLLKVDVSSRAISLEDLVVYGVTALHFCTSGTFIDSDLLNRILDLCPELLFLATDIHPIHLAIILHNNDSLYAMLNRLPECWKRVSQSRLHLKPISGEGRDGKRSKFSLKSTSEIWSRILLNNPALLSDLRIESRSSLLSMKRRGGKQAGNFDSSSFSNNLMNSETTIELSSSYNTIVATAEKHWHLTPLHCAVKASNAQAVKMLISHGATLDSRSPQGTTPLVQAIRSSSNEVVLALLASESSVHGYDHRCHSNVANAAKRDDPDILEKLAAHTHDMSNVDIDNSNLASQIAAEGFSSALVQVRIDAKSLTAQDNFGESVLQRCVYAKQPAALCYLLNIGLDLSSSTAAFGSVLNTLWMDDLHSELKRLLRRLGRETSTVLLNTKPDYRQTPLYNAAAMGQLRILEQLLTYPVDLDMHGGPLGSALMAAASYGRLEAVQTLVDAGASLTHELIEDNTVSNVLTQAKHFPQIQRWLLVDRYTRRKFLTY